MSVRLTIAAGLDQGGTCPTDTDLLIDLGTAADARKSFGSSDQSPKTNLPPFLHPRANGVVRPSDGIGRCVFPVSGGDKEAAEDTLRVIAWHPSPDTVGDVSKGVSAPDLEWLVRTLGISDLPTVICTPAFEKTPCQGMVSDLVTSTAAHGHIVAWLSGHAGPTTCSLHGGIAIILFNTASGEDETVSMTDGILGMLEIGERLSLGLSDVSAASIDMPLCPPADRWHAALTPSLG